MTYKFPMTLHLISMNSFASNSATFLCIAPECMPPDDNPMKREREGTGLGGEGGGGGGGN